MAYVLEAFVAPEGTLKDLVGRSPRGRVIRIHAGIDMTPFTDELRSALGSTEDLGDPEQSWPFRRLSRPAARLAQQASHGQRLAYVEAEYFGGEGDQASIVWEAGSIVSGPSHGQNAINDALRCLGVQAAPGKDEFDTVGLGQWRSTEEWSAQKVLDGSGS
jgi:hypothetical protein